MQASGLYRGVDLRACLGRAIMATINPFIPSPALVKRPGLRIFGGRLKRAAMAISHSWRAYVGYKRLDRLTDRALAKRGLQRGDIGRHVFFDDLA